VFGISECGRVEGTSTRGYNASCVFGKPMNVKFEPRVERKARSSLLKDRVKKIVSFF